MEKSIKMITSEMNACLSGGLLGVMLYGSVVLDDFHPGWSDIDFIAFTSEPITAKQANELLFLRQRLSERHPGNLYFRCFEGITVNVDEYRNKSFSRLVYWGTSGQRITNKHNDDVFARFELAKHGRTVFGSVDKKVFQIPSVDEIKSAIRGQLEAIRKYAVVTDGSLYSCGWLLDVARCIYTLRFHDVISKTRAGEWALSEHIFSDEDALKKTVTIRKEPLLYKDDEGVKNWLSSLGPTVQIYADTLEEELL